MRKAVGGSELFVIVGGRQVISCASQPPSLPNAIEKQPNAWLQLAELDEIARS